jgi:hypothetical protein
MFALAEHVSSTLPCLWEDVIPVDEVHKIQYPEYGQNSEVKLPHQASFGSTMEWMIFCG